MATVDIIRKLEAKRKSRVICYFTGDRPTFPPGQNSVPGVQIPITPEPQLLFYEHLRNIGKVPNIDLVLYTRGGDTNAVWPLVNLIREYCDKFSVLIPFRAHSAGTMIALGADEIMMTEVAELSPIDPSLINPLNPHAPQNPNAIVPVSVEDVISYIKLAHENEGGPALKEETSLVKVFEKLTEAVHPLALGQVNRVYLQIRQLAEELLKLHPDKKRDDKKIVKHFVEKFYSHHHAISRNEAKKLLGNIVKNSTRVPELWALYESIATELMLTTPFNLKEVMGEDEEKEIVIKSGLIQSSQISHSYQTKMKVVQQSLIPPNMQIQVPPGQGIPRLIPGLPVNLNADILSMGWKKDE